MPSLVPKPGSYLQIVDQRKQLREVIWSCWPAVSQPSPHQPDLPFVVRLHHFSWGPEMLLSDAEFLPGLVCKAAIPMQADAIIANPVCYGHMHGKR